MTDVVLEEVRAWQGGALEPIYLRQGASAKPGAFQLAYMSFPKEHWTQICSANPLERVNREIKRRTDVVGVFLNDDAILRLVGALMLKTNDEWAVARKSLRQARRPGLMIPMSGHR